MKYQSLCLYSAVFYTVTCLLILKCFYFSARTRLYPYVARGNLKNLLMKTARIKQIRKLVKSLEKVGYRAPFNILVDCGFLIAYNKSQMGLGVLEKFLNGKVRLLTTHCEYKRYTSEIKEKKLIGNVRLKKCAHKEEFRTKECLSDAVEENNPHHYFLGVSPKYKQLKEELKVPILFMRSGVLCLEIGDISAKEIENKTEQIGLSEIEKKRLDELFVN